MAWHGYSVIITIGRQRFCLICFIYCFLCLLYMLYCCLCLLYVNLIYVWLICHERRKHIHISRAPCSRFSGASKTSSIQLTTNQWCSSEVTGCHGAIDFIAFWRGSYGSNGSYWEMHWIIGKMMIPLGWYPKCLTPVASPLKGDIPNIYPIYTHYIRCIWGWLLRVPSQRVSYNGEKKTSDMKRCGLHDLKEQSPWWLPRPQKIDLLLLVRYFWLLKINLEDSIFLWVQPLLGFVLHIKNIIQLNQLVLLM